MSVEARHTYDQSKLVRCALVRQPCHNNYMYALTFKTTWSFRLTNLPCQIKYISAVENLV
jgi:hypothetical protein